MRGGHEPARPLPPLLPFPRTGASSTISDSPTISGTKKNQPCIDRASWRAPPRMATTLHARRAWTSWQRGSTPCTKTRQQATPWTSMNEIGIQMHS